MAIVNKNEFLKRIVEGLSLDPAIDKTPKDLADKILPVFLVNDAIYYTEHDQILRDATASNTTSATIYSTDPNKDFYLTFLTLSVVKDATSTSTESTITGVINGATRELAHIDGITLTVQNQTVTLSFPTPIRLDRGTNVSVTNSTGVANIKSTGVIGGFLQQ